jgi:phage terminase large subunit
MRDSTAVILGAKKKIQSQYDNFDLSKICFPEQLSFIKDPNPWVIADCSRRSGKTEGCVYDLLDTAIRNEGINCLYITLTRANAERIIWAKLLHANEHYKLQGIPNYSKLSLTFPNGSVIYLSGCNDKSELDKFRGLALKLVYIDEVQSFKSFIKELVDEVLAPALADYAGKMKFIGTPGPIASGFFHKLLSNQEFSRHHWTFWDNPYLPALKEGITHAQVLDRELKRRGVSIDHPSIRREWFGEWVTDTESLVFNYGDHNDFVNEPQLTDYVIGLDFGTDDADAISVLGWHKNFKEVYLVEEYVQNGLSVSEIVAEVEKRYKKYNPLKIVADTGANGKKIALEISKRLGVPVSAADKQRKVEHITWLNDAMRTRKFFARASGRFAQDCAIIEWDYDKSTSDRLIIKDDPHSDICDAVLYSYVEALAWLSEPAKPIKNLKEQWAEFSKNMADDAIENSIKRQKEQENDDNFFATSGLDPEDTIKYFVNKKRGA